MGFASPLRLSSKPPSPNRGRSSHAPGEWCRVQRSSDASTRDRALVGRSFARAGAGWQSDANRANGPGRRRGCRGHQADDRWRTERAVTGRCWIRRQMLRLAGALTRDPDITAIVGQHVHVMQPIARVNGKLVVFGKGQITAWRPGTSSRVRLTNGLVCSRSSTPPDRDETPAV